ncbi:YrzQ family protein [Sutcliffiella cohnii]|uniref:YrzQ family protein n=1 Tax=Sutcliffiella TaxID=2837511 RepID=UPI000A05F591|nr:MULTISPECIES: YrzQ family protein [Sutcliffiella]MED4016416.1 YrzQ family protein [Sutcliffiella cohnii]WBL13933.1 YrzQ family protein [Sutcliffiella sp. NC1]
MNRAMTSLLLIGLGAAATQLGKNEQVKGFVGDMTSTRNMKRMRKQMKRVFS